MLQEALQSYGLTDKEAKIYLCCLEYGMIQPAKIAAKLGIHRSTCYDILALLRAKGIVAETKKKGVLYYTAVSPELLLSGLEQKYTSFKGVLPELLGLTQKFGIRPKIKIFEGLEGMKAMYEDLLFTTTDMCAVLGNFILHDSLNSRFNNDFVPKRVKSKKFAKVLVSHTIENEQYQQGDKSFYRETRFLSHQVDFGCEIVLYGPGKTMIALYNEQDMSGMMIESETLFNTLKVLFETLRDSAIVSISSGKHERPGRKGKTGVTH